MVAPGSSSIRPTRRRVPAAAALWGDDFAHDGLRDLWAVRDWSSCSADEYIVLFPRLVPRAGVLPPVLREHLESCVAVRAWRLSRLERREVPVPLLSCLSDPGHGVARHADWFADGDALTCMLRRLGLLHTSPGRVEAERRLLAVLDLLLADVQAGRGPAWDETIEVLLAFGAGIHPGYLWPEAVISPARGMTAGWLGHLDRGRRALMPMAVAEYLLDAFAPGASPDRDMMAISGDAPDIALLRRAARRRVAGRNPSVRLTSGAVPLKDSFPGRAGPIRAAGARA